MKMSKEQIARLTELVEAVDAAQHRVVAAVEAANEGIERLVNGVNELIAPLNEALADLAAFRDDWAGEVQTFIDEKSERWQEGEAGVAHQSLLDEWEALEIEAVEPFEVEELEFEPCDLDAVAGAPTDTAEV
jgi:hypothetical protein